MSPVRYLSVVEVAAAGVAVVKVDVIVGHNQWPVRCLFLQHHVGHVGSSSSVCFGVAGSSAAAAVIVVDMIAISSVGVPSVVEVVFCLQLGWVVVIVGGSYVWLRLLLSSLELRQQHLLHCIIEEYLCRDNPSLHNYAFVDGKCDTATIPAKDTWPSKEIAPSGQP
jgi:hypothetical protein